MTANSMHETLQQIAEETTADLGITGAQVALSYGGESVDVAVGVANAELGAQMTTDTLIQIGSTTKVYTAVLVMQLADAGLLDIDRPVVEYLPEFRLKDERVTRTVTPRQLMSMNSGIDNGPYIDTGRGDECVAAYVDLIPELPVTFAPGTSYGYSNASTVVSGLLVERLTGLNWDEALRDRLLVPAGLSSSVTLPEDLVYHRVAVGHTAETGEVVRPWMFGRGMGPAGSTLATTSLDLLRFGEIFLRNGLAADGTRILSEAAVAVMQTPQIDVPARWFADAWAVGPYCKRWGGADVFGHSGTNTGGSSTLIWVPEHNAAVAVAVNTPTLGYPFADRVFSEIFERILNVGKPSRPEPNLALAVDPERYAGRYRGHGALYTVSCENGSVVVERRVSDGMTEESLTSTLLPIDTDRFFPKDAAMTSNHMWDIAFTFGEDGQQLLHNGAMTARRIGD